VLNIQLPSSTELSKDWSYTSTPPLALTASTGTNLPFVLLSFHFTFVTNLLLKFVRHTGRANSVGYSLTVSHRRHVTPVYFIQYNKQVSTHNMTKGQTRYCGLLRGPDVEL